MKLSVIHHIAIIVSDYEKSKDFYVNKLGFEIIRENYREQRGDWKLDLRVNDTTELEIFGVDHPPKRVNRPEAAGTEDVEAAAAELKEKGIPTEPVRVDEFSGKRFTFFADPDGLPIELHE